MTKKRLMTIVLASIILMGADATPTPPTPQKQTQPAKSPKAQRQLSRREKLTRENNSQVWNLKDVDLRTVAHEISKATGKNFIIGPKVDDKVSFITSYRLPDQR